MRIIRIGSFLKNRNGFSTSFLNNKRSFSTSTTTKQTTQVVVRTRIAPSPTGSMHLGGLRTALYNYLFAKKHNGQFILRIEDTDKKREVVGAVEELQRDLKWTGIEFDESPQKEGKFGPYIQSQRLPIYQEYIQILLKNGNAYRCFCDEHRLESIKTRHFKSGTSSLYDRFCLSLSEKEVEEKLAAKIPHVIRLKVPAGETEVTDLIRGKIVFQNIRTDDQVLIKSDNFPTYHFANVVDDHLMQISHVIRGEEWLPSTSKHVILYNAFGWKAPQFAHLPLLINPDKSKLSKRQGDINIDFYKRSNILPEALLNFVAFLGWAPTSTREIFSLKELTQEFSLERVHKAPATVNAVKLDWFNQQHLQKKIENFETLKNGLIPQAQEFVKKSFKEKEFSDEYVGSVMAALRERLHRVSDVPTVGFYFFERPNIEKTNELISKMWRWENSENKPKSSELVEKVIELLEHKDFETREQWTDKLIQTKLKELTKQLKIELSTIYQPLRFLMTSSQIGAGIPQTIQILGREETLLRLKNGLKALNS